MLAAPPSFKLISLLPPPYILAPKAAAAKAGRFPWHLFTVASIRPLSPMPLREADPGDNSSTRLWHVTTAASIELSAAMWDREAERGKHRGKGFSLELLFVSKHWMVVPYLCLTVHHFQAEIRWKSLNFVSVWTIMQICNFAMLPLYTTTGDFKSVS